MNKMKDALIGFMPKDADPYQTLEAYAKAGYRAFEGGDTTVRDTWSAYVSGGNAALAEPENYIKLR